MRQTPILSLGLWAFLLMGLAAVTFTALAEEEQEQPVRLPSPFNRFDRDQDGKISASEMPPKSRDRLLSTFDKNNDGVLDLEELRAVVGAPKARSGSKTKKIVPTLDTRVRVLRDQVFATGPSYGENYGKLDLYLPGRRTDFPVLVFIHGGGMTRGDKQSMSLIAERFALKGFGVASINYRLAPEVMYPAFVEDVALAYRWVYDNIGQYGGDNARMYLSGGSAGGYLAAIVTLDESFLKKVGLSAGNITASAPISALTDVSRAGPRLGIVWPDEPSKVKKASPLHHVKKDSPPILVMFADGESEDRLEQNKEFFLALETAGHPNVEIRELKDRIHTTIAPNMAKEGDEALVTLLKFFRKHGARNVPLIPEP